MTHDQKPVDEAVLPTSSSKKKKNNNIRESVTFIVVRLIQMIRSLFKIEILRI
jgi:hypothetical protein